MKTPQKVKEMFNRYATRQGYKCCHQLHRLTFSLSLLVVSAVIVSTWQLVLEENKVSLEPLVAEAATATLQVKLLGNGSYSAAPGNFDGDDKPDFLITDANGTYEQDGARESNYLLYVITDDGTILWVFDTGFDPPDWGYLSIEAAVWDYTGDGIDDVVAQREDANGRFNLIVLDGRTGQLLGETPFPIAGRSQTLLALAFLGENLPSAVVAEGTYSPILAAFDIAPSGSGVSITERWRVNPDGYAHAIETFDIDDDGRDEIVYAGGIYNEDGSVYHHLVSGHADRTKVHDIDPTNPGYEQFVCIESAGGNRGYIPNEGVGVFLIDVDERKILWEDVGNSSTNTNWGHCHRGFIGELDQNEPGYEIWTSGVYYESGEFTGNSQDAPLRQFIYTAKGKKSQSSGTGRPVEWDGDPEIEVLQESGALRNGFGSTIDSLPYPFSQSTGLVDIMGDGKEEIFYGSSDGFFYLFENTGGGSLPVRRGEHNYLMNKARTGSGYWLTQPPDPEDSGDGGPDCGNGQIDSGEQCDGANLNNQTCQTQGFQDGTLSCYPAGGTNACQFNTSQCTSGGPAPGPLPATQSFPLRSLGIPTEDAEYKVGIGDLTGDGETDYVVIAYDDKQRRVSNRIQAYRSDGTFLWERDTGLFSQDSRGHSFAAVSLNVWDMDADGKDEVITQIAGNGIELAILDGLTGAIKQQTSLWGSLGAFTYSTIAYLDGVNPHVVVSHGDPTRIRAYDRNLRLIWEFADSRYDGTSGENLTTFDFDNDGRDEIVNGPLLLNEDGSIYFGDYPGFAPRAFIHDIDPAIPGYEFFFMLADTIGNNAPEDWKGVYLVDVETRRVLWKHVGNASAQTGWGYMHRGFIGELDPAIAGLELWATGFYWEDDEYQRYLRGEFDDGFRPWGNVPDKAFTYTAKGQIIDRSTVNQQHGLPLRWDDDPSSEIFWFRSGKLTDNGFRGGTIRNDLAVVNRGEGFLEADVAGDWREEVVIADVGHIYIYANDQASVSPNRPSPRLGHNYRLNLSRTASGFWKPLPFDASTDGCTPTTEICDQRDNDCDGDVDEGNVCQSQGDWTFCANENEFCSFSGTKEVRYGANGFYNYLVLSNGTECTNAVFGDPIKGVAKQCHFRETTTIPGDINKDGKVDIFDYNLLVENFAKTNCGNIADIDANCKVDIFDYNLLVGNFGK